MLLATLSLFATTIGAVQIHPFGRNDLCIDVQAANFAKDTPVQLWECNGTPAQDWEWGKWDVDWQWRVVGTNWCLRFEGAPNLDRTMAIMDCNGTAYLNYWTVTPFNNGYMIQSTGRYGHGGLYNGGQLQLWYEDRCNPNQLWSF